MSGHLAAIPYLDRPSDTNVSQLAPVGSLRQHVDKTLGFQILRSVKATTAVTKYELCQYDAGSSETVVKSTTDKQKAIICAGFAVASIAAGEYGWFVCAGQAYALGHSSMGTGASILSSTTAGRVDDLSPTGAEHCILGACTDITGWATAGDRITVRVSGLI
jgi:hypothetical protein